MIRWLFLFLGDFENWLEGRFVFSRVLLFVLPHFLFCAEDAVYIGTHGLEFFVIILEIMVAPDKKTLKKSVKSMFFMVQTRCEVETIKY